MHKHLVINPKRKKYKNNRLKNACSFCNDAAENNYHIQKTKHWIIAANQYPFVDYAILIIPRRHFEFVPETTEEEWQDLSKIMSTLASLWTKYYLEEYPRTEKEKILDEGEASYNLYVNNGEHSGQTVRHLHWHFVPRSYRRYTAMEVAELFQKVKVEPKETQQLFKRLLKNQG